MSNTRDMMKILNEAVETNKIQGLENAQNIASQFKNYSAFKSNFSEDIIIVKSNGSYFIYKESAPDYNSYSYYSDSKDNIEGWLYGMAQCKNNIIK